MCRDFLFQHSNTEPDTSPGQLTVCWLILKCYDLFSIFCFIGDEGILTILSEHWNLLVDNANPPSSKCTENKLAQTNLNLLLWSLQQRCLPNSQSSLFVSSHVYGSEFFPLGGPHLWNKQVWNQNRSDGQSRKTVEGAQRLKYWILCKNIINICSKCLTEY